MIKLNSNKIVFEYNEIVGIFWIQYDLIWSVFSKEYGLDYFEAQKIIEDLIFKHYGLKDFISMVKTMGIWRGIEKYYKFKNCK